MMRVNSIHFACCLNLHAPHTHTHSHIKVSLSAFSFLLSEMVQHAQSRVTSIDALERRLEEAGYGVGLRSLELAALRDRSSSAGRRRTRLLAAMQWVSADLWRALFGKTADSLERSTENADEYMIHERQPITNVFVSVPPDLGQVRRFDA